MAEMSDENSKRSLAGAGAICKTRYSPSPAVILTIGTSFPIALVEAFRWLLRVLPAAGFQSLPVMKSRALKIIAFWSAVLAGARKWLFRPDHHVEDEADWGRW